MGNKHPKAAKGGAKGKAKGGGGVSIPPSSGAGGDDGESALGRDKNEGPDCGHEEERVTVTEELSVGEYVIGKELGRGAQGECRLARHREHEGVDYAIKIMVKKPMLRRSRTSSGKYGHARGQAAKEVAIMRKLTHKHCTRVIDVMDDPDDRKFYIVLEYMSGGQLMSDSSTAADKLSEPKARRYFGHLVSALEYLHHQGIIHRDIKPSNCLLDEHDNCKLRYGKGRGRASRGCVRVGERGRGRGAYKDRVQATHGDKGRHTAIHTRARIRSFLGTTPVATIRVPPHRPLLHRDGECMDLYPSSLLPLYRISSLIHLRHHAIHHFVCPCLRCLFPCVPPTFIFFPLLLLTMTPRILRSNRYHVYLPPSASSF